MFDGDLAREPCLFRKLAGGGHDAVDAAPSKVRITERRIYKDRSRCDGSEDFWEVEGELSEATAVSG